MYGNRGIAGIEFYNRLYYDLDMSSVPERSICSLDPQGVPLEGAVDLSEVGPI